MEKNVAIKFKGKRKEYVINIFVSSKEKDA
jgi:hypothetical protein